MRNGQRSLSYCNLFDKKLVLQVRQLFESELDLKSLDKNAQEKMVRSAPLKVDSIYSVFYFFQMGRNFTQDEINHMIAMYLDGTKIIVVVREYELLERLGQAFSDALEQQG